MSRHTSSRRRFVQAVGIGGLGVAATGITSAKNGPKNFRAHLAGRNEVPPVETNAQGQATFQVSKDGREMDFRLIVANIDEVVASHIHCAPEDDNGPIGVTLFTGGPVAVNGILAEGTITAPDPGNGCGWGDLEAVVTAMEEGVTYVNVHSRDHPPGEIRGQIH